MKEKKPISKKRLIAYYLVLAGCILLIAAITVTLIFTVGKSNDIQIDAPDGGGNSDEPDDGGNNPSDGGTADTDNPDGGAADTSSAYEFIMPVGTVSVTTSCTFHYNQTLDCYYMHQGIDFAADAGTEVYAVLDGTVTSITTGDELYGTVITLSHADNYVTTYTFVDAVEGLAVGDAVSRGDVIATVAQATGIEYKDGPHLHFEVYQSGTFIDPETVLDLSEK